MRLLSCYVRNHMHFQCLCEVYIMDIVHLYGQVAISMGTISMAIASTVI